MGFETTHVAYSHDGCENHRDNPWNRFGAKARPREAEQTDGQTRNY